MISGEKNFHYPLESSVLPSVLPRGIIWRKGILSVGMDRSVDNLFPVCGSMLYILSTEQVIIKNIKNDFNRNII